MKTARAWLLLLLVLVLPLRGVLAGALACPADGAQGLTHVHGAALHVHDDEGAFAGGDVHLHEHGGAVPHHHGAGPDKCNLCASCCPAAGPLASSALYLAPLPASAGFPVLHAPPPDFVSGGQERPPRTV